MRLTLHILKKDLRRLWPAIAITLAMLALLGHADSWRADSLPSDREGWLNLLLPLAWACLIALAVLQEPLIGDRHFWQTCPYRWGALLAAKLTFAAIAIHIPLLLCHLYILQGRGFLPTADMFTKQAMLAAFLTLPSLALAALVRNFTQFILALFAIAAVLLFIGGLQAYPDYSRQSQQVRHAALLAVVVLGAAGIALIQYSRRKPMLARGLAIATFAATIGVSTYLPIQAEYRTANQPRLALREATRDPVLFHASRWPSLRTVLIPIAFEPGSFHVPFVEVQVETPTGVRIKSFRPGHSRAFDRIPLIAHPYRANADGIPQWLMLIFSAEAWNRVKDSRVQITGDAGIAYYRLGNAVSLPMKTPVSVSGVGRCVSSLIESSRGGLMLKAFCEQAAGIPHSRVILSDAASGRTWRQALNVSMLMNLMPNRTWLSPVARAQAFFHIATPDELITPTSPYIVPQSALANTRIEITPEIPAGNALASFKLANIQLADWAVRR